MLNTTPNIEKAKEKYKPKETIPPTKKRAASGIILQESEFDKEKEAFSEDDYACIYCTESYKISIR